MTYQLIHGDCLEVLPILEFDNDDNVVVITDPPYGISGSTGKINAQRNKTTYDGSFLDTPQYIDRVVIAAIGYCISRFKAVIVTPGIRNMMKYPQPNSFGCFYQPAAVGVQTFGNLDAQPILYYGKNATKKNLGKKCSFKMTTRADESRHPCRKPTKEWEQLILNHTLPGQTIIDPFMGSGTTGEIAVKNGRNFVGIELSEYYIDEARERIANAAGDFVQTEKEKATGQMSLFD